MQRALQLARLGLGVVSPNPMVGCLVVHQGKIIGEGYHKKYGGAHAEVEAINQVEDKDLLKKSTVYVTLEPCSHQGKTPPCAPMLANYQIPQVVIASIDVNPLVSGNGVMMLQQSGVVVKSGLLKKEADQLNKRFNTYFTLKRPYITLKWAQTADGFIARENFDSKWISNEFSRMLVHKWRTEEDAIMVGTNTVQYDNPQLNVRNWEGRNPVRVIIDRNLRLSSQLNIYDQSIPTLIYNCHKNDRLQHLQLIKLEEAHFFKNLFTDLHQRKIQSVLIEGGAATIKQCIELNFWDEARVFTGKQIFNTGIKAPYLQNFQLLDLEMLFDDQLSIYKNKDNIYI